MAPRTIEEYVHSVIIEDKTLKNVDPEIIQQLEADYVKALEGEITAALVTAVPDADMPELEKMIENGPTPEVKDWMDKKVPNASDIVAGVLLRFRADYMSADDVL